MALVSLLIFASIFGLIDLLGFWRKVGLDDVLIIVLIIGLCCTMILGGGFALKHFVLRLFLWKCGSAPIHYAVFAAQAKDLLFLRQVGGGYIFVHRLLRDYFPRWTVRWASPLRSQSEELTSDFMLRDKALQ